MAASSVTVTTIEYEDFSSKSAAEDRVSTPVEEFNEKLDASFPESPNLNEVLGSCNRCSPGERFFVGTCRCAQVRVAARVPEERLPREPLHAGEGQLPHRGLPARPGAGEHAGPRAPQCPKRTKSVFVTLYSV